MIIDVVSTVINFALAVFVGVDDGCVGAATVAVIIFAQAIGVVFLVAATGILVDNILTMVFPSCCYC